MSDYTIAIDGSTYSGSAALLDGDEVIAERMLPEVDTPGRQGRAEGLFPAVVECLEEAGVPASSLARVVCGAGPGSFTSLRIAAAIAKGLASGAGCQMYAVSSLLLSVAAMRKLPDPGLYLPVTPAMRGEVFAAEVAIDDAAAMRQTSPARIIADSAVDSEAERLGARSVGTGRDVESAPHARGVARLLPALLRGPAADLEAWEPEYGRLAEAQVRWEAVHGPLRVP